MGKKSKKIIAIALTVLVVSLQLTFVKPASAGGLPVIDIVHIGETVIGWAGEAYRWAQENGILKVALQNLKKRLLDTMTDQIVNWINGGGKPKFTQDFGSVFRTAADQAVGDVLQQYAATQALCQPFAFNINLQLQQPAPLSQQVRCSLSDVISNFNAYRGNFANGGWLAYQELLKPQNNQWGVEIITQNEIYNRTAQKMNESVLRQQINVGFNSEECLQWDVYSKKTNRPATTQGGAAYASLGVVLGPDGKPKAPDDNPPPPPGNDPNLEYRCTKSQITTPGRALATGLEKSLYSGLDFVINAQELSNYLAIIADAAFNKLIKAGASGVSELLEQHPTAPTGLDQTDEARGYLGAQSQVTQNVRNTYLGQLRPAADALASASSALSSASSTNRAVVNAANELLSCPTGANAADTQFAKSAISSASSTQQTISIKLTLLNAASSAVSGLITDIGSGSCNIACLNQNQRSVSDAVNTANSLNVDANNILLGVQTALSELKTRQSSDCHI